jgi:hypothetical protein
VQGGWLWWWWWGGASTRGDGTGSESEFSELQLWFPLGSLDSWVGGIEAWLRELHLHGGGHDVGRVGVGALVSRSQLISCSQYCSWEASQNQSLINP